MKLNPSNERLKHRYFQWLRDARQMAEKSIEQVAMALDRFEDFTQHRDFKQLRMDQAGPFKKHLAKANGKRSGDKLSKATINSTLYAMRDFVRWLAEQKGFRNRLVATDAEYFNPSRHDEAIARAQRPMKVPELWQIEAVVDAMPTSTIIERRNRAIVALIILTGARDNAVASLRLGDLDLEGQELFQDSRHVRTKFRKTYSTWFFPVGGNYVDIVTNWVSELAEIRGRDPATPLFPRTETRFGKDGTTPEAHLGSEGWANADPIRKLFKEACKAAGMPDFKPHSLRHMLARIGEQRAASAEDMKSWSQNLGHENMLTTFTSYGQVPAHRQKEVVLRMTAPVT
jgi:integrase